MLLMFCYKCLLEMNCTLINNNNKSIAGMPLVFYIWFPHVGVVCGKLCFLYLLHIAKPSPINNHLCTPPMPPVTNTLMPARAASSMVPLTVVAPSRLLPSTSGMSRRDTLRTAVPFLAMCSNCSLSQPAEGQRGGVGNKRVMKYLVIVLVAMRCNVSKPT